MLFSIVLINSIMECNKKTIFFSKNGFLWLQLEMYAGKPSIYFCSLWMKMWTMSKIFFLKKLQLHLWKESWNINFTFHPRFSLFLDLDFLVSITFILAVEWWCFNWKSSIVFNFIIGQVGTVFLEWKVQLLILEWPKI